MAHTRDTFLAMGASIIGLGLERWDHHRVRRVRRSLHESRKGAAIPGGISLTATQRAQSGGSPGLLWVCWRTGELQSLLHHPGLCDGTAVFGLVPDSGWQGHVSWGSDLSLRCPLQAERTFWRGPSGRGQLLSRPCPVWRNLWRPWCCPGAVRGAEGLAGSSKDLSEMHLVSRDTFAGPVPFLACKCPCAPVLSSCQHFIPHTPWQGGPTSPPSSLLLLVPQIIPHFPERDSLLLSLPPWALIVLLRVCLSLHGTPKATGLPLLQVQTGKL